MKKSIIYFFFAALLTGFASCSKDDDPPPGAPTISRVTTSNNRTTPLANGELNQWLIIQGKNLSGTQKVVFNDLEAAYKDIFSNDTLVSVQIPRKIPGTINNKLTLTTNYGTVSFDFPIEIPQLKSNGFEFDYPAAGATLTILGDNFDLYGFTKEGTTVTFTGGATAQLTEATATSLKLTVPNGAQPGAVTIKGAAPLSTTFTTAAWYQDNRGSLVNMDPFGGWNGAAFIANGPDPAPFEAKKYFRINKAWAGGWAWAPFLSASVPMPAGVVGTTANLNDYDLKFEVYAANGSTGISKPINIVFQGNGFKDFMFDPSGKGQYPFTTNGKWVTVSCPMKNFTGYTFLASTIMEVMLKAADPFNSDFSITNFRIVPNK